MKVALALLLLLTTLCRGKAQEVLTGVSPDGKYGVLSSVLTSAPARLVALPSRQTLVQTLIDSQGEAPSVLWSADSRRLFCWIQQARFTTYTAYRLDAGAFVELTLPNYLVPAVRKFQAHPQTHGEENIAGVRWLADGALVIGQAGILRLLGKSRARDDIEEVDYAYLVTFSFDRRGVGHVRKIVKDKEG